MKLISIALIGACLVCPICAHAQLAKVINTNDGAVIPGATLSGGGHMAIADADGQADVSGLKGQLKLEASALGYKSRALSWAELLSDSFLVELEPAHIIMDEVVVSASRLPEWSGQVPGRIRTLQREDIAALQPQTMADLLGFSGEVFVQKSQQGGGSPMIRGYAANRLLYAVDGVRMNTAIFRGGNLQNVISLDAFATEQAEVLFGPGSVMYGSDAVGGVMSFETLSPVYGRGSNSEIRGGATLRGATANAERTGHFHASVGWEKWAVLTSFTYNRFGHLRQGRHGPEDYLKPYFVQRRDTIDEVAFQEDPLEQRPTAYDQFNLMQKVHFRANEDIELRYAFHYSATSPYGRYDRHNRMRQGAPRYAQWDYGPQEWMMNHLSASFRNGPLYDRARISLAHQQFGESRIDRGFNNPVQRERVERVAALSANADFEKSWPDGHLTRYGLEWVHNDVVSTGTDADLFTGAVVPAAPRYPQASWQSMAVYLAQRVELASAVTLQGGLRYNHYVLSAEFDPGFYDLPFRSADLSNGALTGSAGLVWRPSERWALRTNLGTAFRSPNVDDIGKVFDSEPGAVTVPNPGLKAEYAWSADVGAAHSWEWLEVEVTGYYSYLDRALVRRNFSLNGQDSLLYDGVLSQVQAIQNAAAGRVVGLQGRVEARSRSGFRAALHLNWQQGEEELDNGEVSPSRHAAPAFGQAQVGYAGEGFEISLWAQAQAEREAEGLAVEERGKTEIYALDAEGRAYAPAWYTLNVRARVFLSASSQLSTGLENLTDQRYRPYSSGVSGPGRNFFLSLTARF